VVVALERLRVRYLLGGSVASSAWGVPRGHPGRGSAGRDPPVPGSRLAAALGSGWYADPQVIGDAIQAGRPFNIIHIPTGQKFDIFPPTGEFHQAELSRATPMSFEIAGQTVRCPLATAEDILLAKLQWYRAGGEISQRQWSDVLGLLAMNRALDRDYLSMWAQRLGVQDLLARAFDARI